jgi:hypothetical protein
MFKLETMSFDCFYFDLTPLSISLVPENGGNPAKGANQ